MVDITDKLTQYIFAGVCKNLSEGSAETGMLNEYEEDFRTGMDIGAMAGLIYDYTSGYPFLVSKLCKLIDEEITGTDKFKEEDGRRYFLLYLRPIINGTGNYYIESRTR